MVIHDRQAKTLFKGSRKLGGRGHADETKWIVPVVGRSRLVPHEAGYRSQEIRDCCARLANVVPEFGHRKALGKRNRSSGEKSRAGCRKQCVVVEEREADIKDIGITIAMTFDVSGSITQSSGVRHHAALRRTRCARRIR